MRIHKEGNFIHIDGEGETFHVNGETMNIEADDKCAVTICNCIFMTDWDRIERELEERVVKGVKERIEEITRSQLDVGTFIKDPISNRFDLLDLD